VLARGKGERYRAALTRDPCPTLRAMADWMASGRGASNEKSTRLPAASTTGLGNGLASVVGQKRTAGHGRCAEARTFTALLALASCELRFQLRSSPVGRPAIRSHLFDAAADVLRHRAVGQDLTSTGAGFFVQRDRARSTLNAFL
jgi:hypothetical protein